MQSFAILRPVFFNIVLRKWCGKFFYILLIVKTFPPSTFHLFSLMRDSVGFQKVRNSLYAVTFGGSCMNGKDSQFWKVIKTGTGVPLTLQQL